MKKITLTIIAFIFSASAIYAEEMEAFQGVKTTPLTQEELKITVTPNPKIVELIPNDSQVVVLLPPDAKKVVPLLPPDKKIVRQLLPR